MTDESRQQLARLRADFPYYARSLLKVRTKSGSVEPLDLNRAQLFLHDKLEQQRSAKGRVRALVLKGRQQGVSTYLQGRYFWKVAGEFGKRAYILTHEQVATDNLFGMTRRYLDNLPPAFTPSTGAANAKALYFDRLDSGYQVATAGSKDTGRSGTAQYFHGSEVAFWPNAEAHMAGIGQVVPDLPGTEIVLESTANGIGGLFHNLWQSAECGESDFEAIFIPWFWQTEYRREVAPEFRKTPEEDVLAKAYGLDDEQIAWRRAKIATDFGGDPLQFQQEYPSTASEAFVAIGHEALIPPSLALSAVTAEALPSATLVVGVDPARFGNDSTAIVRRRGRVVMPNLLRIQKRDTMHVVGQVVAIIREERPTRVFIDVGGLGAGIYDRLVELGFGYVITPINFGQSAGREDRYVNKRSEMWGEMKAWLQAQPAKLPKDDTLIGDLSGPTYTYDSNGRLKLESKDDMRKRGVKSPDVGDALALTFAMPVAEPSVDQSPSARMWEDLIAAHDEVAGDGAAWPGINTG